MGFFIEALLRYGESADKVAPVLQSLFMHIYETGLGTISEFFDGDFPHEPRGCIAQAWSVAELIRANNMIQRKYGKNGI
jgi:glycogen debranching enzyme